MKSHATIENNTFFSFFKSNYGLYLMLIPAVVYYIIFQYIPMFGLVISFQDYNIFQGVFNSTFNNFDNFKELFAHPYFWDTVKNTLVLNLLNLVFTFPAPVILALSLNELRSQRLKRITQSVLYLPYFMSWIILAGIMINTLSPQYGIVNTLLRVMGFEEIYFMANSNWWIVNYVLSSIWQSAGWGSIIYMAALTGINPALYEAAMISGAGRFRQMLHITLPGLMPTIVMMFILKMGSIVSIGYEQPMALYNSIVSDVSRVISIFIYQVGIEQGRFAITTAMGFIQSVINLLMIVSANYLSRKFTEQSIY